MDLIEYSRSLGNLANENRDLLGSEVEVLRSEHGIDSPDSLKEAITEVSAQNRLLNIGIVGRVKAGKSSLLNALFFNGRSILPKAATPMTAALTTLSYGDTFSARVEFYSQDDLGKIQERAKLYEQRLNEAEERLYRELSERHKKAAASGKTPPKDSEIREKANEAATKELRKDLSLDAAHDQAARVRASGVNPVSLEQQATISANSPDELAERLADYVGSSGRYMPFTKIVHIAMPLEELRDIQVIDTPGLNDPVQSREERTIELLKTCDVVFIVSPAGQFLNEQDLEMLGRITAKEGVQELVLISSQVDMQLHASEKRARLSEALENIRKQFAERAKTTLSALKKSNPEVGTVFDALIGAPADYLLHSSGVAYSLVASLDERDKWDENERHTWDQLTYSYPDFFSLENLDVSRNSLSLLANIPAIRERLAAVRAKKEKITSERLAALTASKHKGLEAFCADLIRLSVRQIERINSADIGDLSNQIKSLNSKRKKLESKVEPIYENCMGEYRRGLRFSLVKDARNLLGETSEKVEQSGGETTESRTREKSGAFNWMARKLWDGGKENYQVTVHSVMTGQVAGAIQRFIGDMAFRLSAQSEQSKNELDKNLSRSLVSAISETLDDDCDNDLIFEAIRAVINNLPDDRFDLGIELPHQLKARGTLKGHDAEQYKDAAADFISDMDNEVTRKIDRFIRDIKDDAPSTVSDVFVDNLEVKIAALKDQKENADQVISRLQGIVAKLKGI